MAFRLIVSETPDLTTIRAIGRLGDDAVALLSDACGRARRPLVLDLSELTTAHEAGVLLLRRLAAEGVHLLGASRYVALLLAAPEESTVPALPRRSGVRPSGRLHRIHRRPKADPS
jgi:hypothetical protein